jgi:hypothetical protein
VIIKIPLTLLPIPGLRNPDHPGMCAHRIRPNNQLIPLSMAYFLYVFLNLRTFK